MNSGSYSKNTTFERYIAKLYLFLLPIRMISPLLGVANLFHGAAIYFDFFLNVFGILIYLIRHNFVIKIFNDDSWKVFKTFILSICTLNLLSILMAIITQATKGSYAGETAFSGIFGMQIYFFQYIMIIAYNRHVFHLLTEEEIKSVISKTCFALLILGYYQLLVLLFGGFFRSFLEIIDVFDILWPDSSMWKLSLTGKEGASAGTIFAIFVLPFLLGQLLDNKNNKKNIIIMQIILWVPLLVMMQSSSAYLMTFATICGFLLCKFSSDKRRRNCIILFFIIGIVCLLPLLDFIADLLPPDIKYLVFDKALDMKNGSTVARFVPFATNWQAFLQSPIIGVGNGLQGYYYVDYFPEWARNVAGSDVMTFYNTAKTQIINGGLFFPSILSGYGLVGLLLVLNIFIKIKNRMHALKGNTFAYNFFMISMWAILVCGFQSEFAGNYLIWFVIGLPFMEYEKKDGI